MAGFELRHPVGMTTNTFQPGIGFEVSGSSQERIEQRIGIRVDRLLYSYTVGSASIWRYTRSLAILSVANMTALEAFLAAVAGDPFEFQDGTCGPITSWTKVALDPESYTRRYEYRQGQRQQVQLFLLEVP
jgi:hypothetical protein